jgi:hypothetical protein
MGMSVDGAARYTEQPLVQLADQTDPWLQYPDGSVVTLAWHMVRLEPGPCGDCRGGFFAPTDNGPTDQGVERCDDCLVHPGDLDAAVALAALIGPDVEVWFLPDLT